MYRVRILNLKNHIEEVSLPEGSYTIGRALNADIRLESDEVSRIHARLLIGKQGCELIDEDSSNGTYVNGRKVKSCILRDRDKIQIGRFQLEFITQHRSEDISSASKSKNRLMVFLLILSLCILTGGAFYPLHMRVLLNHYRERLALLSARYIAEHNKEALYLGEYTSIDIKNIPDEVKKLAIYDRHNRLRNYFPEQIQPSLYGIKEEIAHIQKEKILKKGNSYTVYLPIYYNTTRVGTLWTEVEF